MKQNKTLRSNKAVACCGAWLALAAVLFYSILIMGYVVIRTSATIYTIMPREALSGILWANGISIAYSVAIFSLMMAIISSVGGAIGAVILKKMLLFFNPSFHSGKARLISCIAGLLMLSMTYGLLHALLKERMTMQYVETLLCWFAFPSIIALNICIIGGSKLNNEFTRQ